MTRKTKHIPTANRHLSTPSVNAKQSKPAQKTSLKSTQSTPKKLNTGVTILKKLLQSNNSDLKAAIASQAKRFYGGEEAKPLQIDAVANLARGRNTFLLAGTGFGKSRISEIYSKLLPQNTKPVVLVLNPLDALGDNQVAKKKGKFTAINLIKLTFNKNVAEEIKQGNYNFVYLSPEIFLNNKLWDLVYFSTEFQQQLALVVVDEAHMVYLWGLVESNGRRVNAVFIRLEDIRIF
ncbi:hypothetical protein PTTG_25827 [Puccinia triticina 1-1 BBBD Race 1]|uniref:DNA 3'-5' helicase n=1 Tax=Puccinia triticina (isolate 1-1 / race 1 (BBBD)) TaxID=630390 RepID=A0A180H0Z1_PUCT1|nr:hypothetical protein PTTG_25827 [Puccinia triticina 1-1 BBBD Race 1]